MLSPLTGEEAEEGEGKELNQRLGALMWWNGVSCREIKSPETTHLPTISNSLEKRATCSLCSLFITHSARVFTPSRAGECVLCPRY